MERYEKTFSPVEGGLEKFFFSVEGEVREVFFFVEVEVREVFFRGGRGYKSFSLVKGWVKGDYLTQIFNYHFQSCTFPS